MITNVTYFWDSDCKTFVIHSQHYSQSVTLHRKPLLVSVQIFHTYSSISFPGNNIFGNDIPQFLRDISITTERNAYILMDRIQPVPVEGYAVFADKPVELGKFTAELGIFGILVG